MMFINKMLRLFSATLILFLFNDVRCQGYQYSSIAKGWLQAHKVKATWDKAFQQCKDEGAVLAAPFTKELIYGMQSMMADNKLSTPYFIDMKAKFVPGVFVSEKGISLEDLPVGDMITILDASLGNCTSMDRDTIDVVPCDVPLPFICYRKHDQKETLTECGTFDKEYKLSELTGSCYKLHENQVLWDHAYTTCIAEGGYLAILNDVNEAKVVEAVVNVNETYQQDVLRQTGRFSYVVAVGIKDLTGNNDWFSVHGDSINDIYNNWDGATPPSNTKPCGGIERSGKPGNLSYYNYDCKDPRPFVCEKDTTKILFKTE